MSDLSLAQQQFNNFSSWTQNAELNSKLYETRMNNVEQSTTQIESEYASGEMSKERYDENVSIINDYKKESEQKYNDYLSKYGEFDATVGGRLTDFGILEDLYENGIIDASDDLSNSELEQIIEECKMQWHDLDSDGEINEKEQGEMDAFYANQYLADGQIETFDSDEDGKLNYNEWLASELTTAADVNDYLKDGFSEEDFQKAIEEKGDISSLLKDEYKEEFGNIFNNLSSDGESIDDLDLASYYDMVDRIDGKYDGKFHAA